MFGCVLCDDFSMLSDVDVLVTFAPAAEISLFDMAQMQIDLQDIFQRPVVIMEKVALRYPCCKREILNAAQVVIAA